MALYAENVIIIYRDLLLLVEAYTWAQIAGGLSKISHPNIPFPPSKKNYLVFELCGIEDLPHLH